MSHRQPRIDHKRKNLCERKGQREDDRGAREDQRGRGKERAGQEGTRCRGQGKERRSARRHSRVESRRRRRAVLRRLRHHCSSHRYSGERRHTRHSLHAVASHREQWRRPVVLLPRDVACYRTADDSQVRRQRRRWHFGRRRSQHVMHTDDARLVACRSRSSRRSSATGVRRAERRVRHKTPRVARASTRLFMGAHARVIARHEVRV